MANDEHVALLKKGVAAWNAWRKENPDIRPDLSQANLSGANLMGQTSSGRTSTGRTSGRRTSVGHTSGRRH